MSFISCDPNSHTGKTNIWLTPMYIIRNLGHFDLDPCAYPNHKTAETLIYPPQNGLDIPWDKNKRVWLNPPYGKQTKLWLNRLQEHGNGIALVFQRLETEWLQPFVEANGVFLIKGRISFLNWDFKTVTNAGCGSCLIPFGKKNIAAILNSEIKGIYLK